MAVEGDASEEVTIDRQLLVELGRTSDINKFFGTATPEAADIGSPLSMRLGGATPRSAASISSMLQMSRARSHPMAGANAMERDNVPRTTPVREPPPLTSQSELLGVLAKAFSEAGEASPMEGVVVAAAATAAMNSSTDCMPMRLLELSLESPSLGRPSIEMPSTFSRAPLAKKPLAGHPFGVVGSGGLSVSSQESVFVAATQFPLLEGLSQRSTSTNTSSTRIDPPASSLGLDRSKGTLKSTMESINIPPTQYPAPEVFAAPSSEIPTPGTTIVQSQAVDLFGSTISPALFSPVSQNPAPATTDEGPVEALLTPRDAIILPLSEEGNPFLAALSSPKFGTARKIRFAPTPRTPSRRSAVSLLSSVPRKGRKSASPLAATDQASSSLDPLVRETQRGAARSSLSTTAPLELESVADALVSMSTSASTSASMSASTSASKSVSKISTPKNPTRKKSTLRTSTPLQSPAPLPSPTPLRNATLLRKRPRTEAATQKVPSTPPPPPSVSSLMCVWARWRPLLFAPALLQNRTSRTRNLWRVRFCHWHTERHVVVAADDFVACDANGLWPGDELFVVRHRSRQRMDQGVFVKWDGADALWISLGREDGLGAERVELTRIVIKRELFKTLQKRQSLPFMTDISHPPTEICSSPIPSDDTRTDFSLAKRPVHPRSTILAGRSFWLTLGSLPAAAKRTQKALLIARIQRLGGRVVEGEEEGERLCQADPAALGRADPAVPCRTDPAVFCLLSNAFCRTTKTFLALLLGVPIVSVEWLHACELSGRCLSFDAHRIVVPERPPPPPPPPPPPLTSGRGRGTPLAGWTLAIEGSIKFVQSWMLVSRIAGAHLVSHYPEMIPRDGPMAGRCRVLVERFPSGSSRLARWAAQAGVAIVTVEWIIDIIISGTPPEH